MNRSVNSKIISNRSPFNNPLPSPLNNRYFLMRHGESHANRQGIIISDPKIGTIEFGLTGLGIEQVIKTASETRLNYETIIYCSDFLRTVETADAVARIIDTDTINTEIALRERFFGEWDGTGTDNYVRVWNADEKQENQQKYNVESVESVAKRTTQFIQTLESQHQNKNILLVSHGDTLQILMTAFSGVCPTTHRKMNPIKTAEIRALVHPEQAKTPRFMRKRASSDDNLFGLE